jgi:hypothetical protein
MPAPALPQPRNSAVMVRYRRLYRDLLDRPMTGTVTLTNATRVATADRVIPARTSVPVELVDGVLDVHLPPNTYRVVAQLRTADGEELTDQDTVTLDEPADA